MTTFNWNIVNTEYKVENKFIVTVHYSITATDGDYTANTYGTVGYTQQPDEQYTPYDQLTEPQVVGWVQESLGKDTVEASLDAQIEAQKHPVQESGLPWA